MENRKKYKNLRKKTANAAADLALINEYSVKKLEESDVYCISLVLCDNEVDRDLEAFTEKTLRQLAPLFVGKTGLSDHAWSCERQIARVYRTEVEKTDENTSYGAPLCRLLADAYILRTPKTETIIADIEGGILKEVSVGCAVERQICAVCGAPMAWDAVTGQMQCQNGHELGEHYGGALCFCALDGAADAFEFSFVAVPAQKGAGVQKEAQDVEAAFKALLKAKLAEYPDLCEKLSNRLKMEHLATEERRARAQILQENQKYLTKERNETV